MESNKEIFYKARDRRTSQFEANTSLFERPIKLFIGDDVSDNEIGQVFLYALLNMLCRVHRRITLVVSPQVAIANRYSNNESLEIALVALAKSIDPFIQISVLTFASSLPVENELVVGAGLKVPNDLACYFGWQGGRAEVSNVAVAAGDSRLDLMGAATASCLAAATVFRFLHDTFIFIPRRLNLVERSEGDKAGKLSVVGPVDVGNVHLIGAGAVAHGLLYWLREIGITGNWEIVDGDLAEIHNTNRCMGMVASDAGWPNGIQSREVGLNKAIVASRLIGASPHPFWYDQSPLLNRDRPDLLIPLANGRSIRSAVAGRGFPIILHATTSINWTAELHRHIAGKDECIACRFPEALPDFECSSGPADPSARAVASKVNGDEELSDDAALPFLSATAGLMLAISLLQIASDQPFIRGRENHWVLHLMMGQNLVRPSIRINPDCSHLAPADFRRRIHSSASARFDFLDEWTS